MKDNMFYDTSILVYAFDETEKKKRDTCRKIVEDVFKGERKGIISNQILAELYSVLTKKMNNPLDSETAGKIVNTFINSENWVKINYSYKTVSSTMSLSKKSGTPIWDSIIGETMKENNIIKIYTENEKDFNKIHGIRVINPMK